MTLEEILHIIGSGIGVVIVLLLGFIKIPKKEINIWGLIGKQLTKDVDDKITNLSEKITGEETRFEKISDKFKETNDKIEEEFSLLDEKLEKHIEDSIEDQMKVRRRAILEFDDQLSEGRKKSKEHYINILDTIDHYEKYCNSHPNFPNNMCLFAIEHIKHEYEEHLDKNDF